MSSRSRDLISSVLVGAGICPAELYGIAEADTAFFDYWNQWFDPDKFGTDISTVFGLMTAGRGDTMIAMPGKYTETASLAWNKAHTHLIGFGGPVQGHYRTASLSDMSNVLIHNATANVASVINITGENCQFHNVQIHNEGNHANNVAAVIVDKFGCFFKGVNFRGATATLPLAEAACGSLQIDGAGHYATFEDCWIGHNTYSAGVKTGAYSGHLIFSEGFPQNGRFTRCRFQLRSQTSTVGLVRFSQSVSADREWLFEDCSFDNFYADHAAELDAVFVYAPAASPQTSNFNMKNCQASGFNEWTVKNWGGAVAERQVRGSMAVPSKGGGLVISLETNNAG